MDYTTAPLLFQAKKALRYVRMYGPSRTLAKIRGQYHMKRQYERLPEKKPRAASDASVGLIGCGNFGFSHIAYYLNKFHGHVIRGAMDVNIHRAASLYQTYQLDYYTDDVDQILDDPKIGLIYIASNHASHAEYAIEALQRGKNVHIEKPHVVSHEQLKRLCRAAQASSGKVVALGFNRPNSPIGKKIREHLASQSGAAMFNWFVAGHEIPADHWYFEEAEGGRVLGNLCHWTDFVYQLVAPECRYPLTIRPTRSVKSDCDIAVSYVFGDGSIAAITFSAKGHTFEGVRERFSAHRGDVLISMEDFSKLTVEIVDSKLRTRQLLRDHGHKNVILNSYRLGRSDNRDPGLETSYIWETADLFLSTRKALEERTTVTLEAYQPSCLD